VSVAFGLVIVAGAVLSSFKLGDNLWHYRLISQIEGDLNDIFHYYSSFGLMWKSWWMSIQLTIRKLAWSIIIFMPSIIIGSWSIFTLFYYSDNFDSALISFGFILSACLLVLGVICNIEDTF
jgi:hypothetical protein